MQLMAPSSLRWQSPLKRFVPVAVAACVLANFLMAGFLAIPTPAAAGTNQPRVAAVAAENQYANVISQIGRRYVSVAAIMSNPNTDPHEFEASASVAAEVSQHSSSSRTGSVTTAL